MGRGKLVFKGEEKAKKKRGSSRIKSGVVEFATAVDGGGGVGGDVNVEADGGMAFAPADDGVNAARAADDGGAHRAGDVLPPENTTHGRGGPSVGVGRGMISTSSSVVYGHGTAFGTELRAGDAILATPVPNGIEEMRVITMVLSNASASISSAFSSDLKTPTSFRYVSRPRDDKREGAMRAAKARREQEEVERRAMGTYGDKGEIIYREKTEHGGYRIRRERATMDMTRSDLLSVREKKKSDRYC
ncbi:hypothetical protein ACHAXA_009359 [Cyclostephanos tholiformis]|uniref:Uncharacterized protein n=1 Tax=Cyclostephanos tholiformis TaxID=382380 RepID=A0ABD3SQV4_9STRA